MNSSRLRPGRRAAGPVVVAAMAITAAAIPTVDALAATPRPATVKPTVTVLKAVHVGAAREPVAVTAAGHPVYELLPETTKHLLCASSACLKVWPAVTVVKGAEPIKGAGLKGTLSTFKRGSMTQVTFNGHPLYTFAEDTSKGTAHGDGIHGFGGTWHVFRQGAATSSAPAGGSSSATTTTTTTTTTAPPTTSTGTYTYPSYPGY